MSSEKRQEERKKASRIQQKATAIDMNFVVSNILFPSVPKNRFRLIVSSVSKEEVLIKLEKLRSPHVWLCTVKEISEFGSAGLPRAAVLNVLKEALNSLSGKESVDDLFQNDEPAQKPAAAAVAAGPANDFASMRHPVVDAIVNDDGTITLELDIPVGGIPMVYSFDMTSLKREHIDILETSLNDARDEITSLRNEVTALKSERNRTCTIVLRTTVQNPPNQVTTWNTVQLHVDDLEDPYFSRSADQQKILIHRPGVYLVNARVMNNDGSGSRTITLKLDEVDVAHANMGFNTAGHSTSVYFNDVIQIEEADDPKALRIHFTSDRSMSNGLLNSHFTVIRLG